MGQSTDEIDEPRRRVVYTTGSQARHEDRTRGARPDGEERDVATIRAEIARTRGEMSATIDALQYKLQPERIKRQMRARVKGATIGKAEEMLGTTREAGSGMLDRIRQNPIPAAMVAIGLGWLMTRQPERDRGYYDYDDYDGGYGADEYDRYGAPDVREKVRDRAGEVRDRAGEIRDRVGERASEMRDQMDQRTTELRSRATHQAQRARGTLEQMMDDNPLGLGAIALAAGAAIGLAAPSTSRENELMGDARDSLMDRAQSSAQEAVTKAKQVAGNVAEDVREETRKP